MQHPIHHIKCTEPRELNNNNKNNDYLESTDLQYKNRDQHTAQKAGFRPRLRCHKQESTAYNDYNGKPQKGKW